MAKRKAISNSERTALAKININYRLKNDRLSSSTRKGLEKLSSDLYRKRTMTSEQYAEYKRLIATAEQELVTAERKSWRVKKDISSNKLDKTIAKRISGVGEKKALSEYEPSFARRIAQHIDTIHDNEYDTLYKSYTIEEKQDVLRRLLGIGSRGVELSDGTTFTVDEFNAILDRHNIPLSRFTDKDDIARERYKQERYKEWKKSINDDIKQLLNLSDLTPREREGLRKMFKIYGT